MHSLDSSRVVFHSANDMSGFGHLQKGESILKGAIKPLYVDINEVLELYHISQYLDAGLSLPAWTLDETNTFQLCVSSYKKIIGRFFSNLDDTNVERLFNSVIYGYVSSFWQIFNDQNVSNRVSASVIERVLAREPVLIKTFLLHSKLVDKYSLVLRDFLLKSPKSAEILLSIYEINDPFNKPKMMLPKSLTLKDKELILSNYLDSDSVNLNYALMIKNMRIRADLKVSDKTRLKAKQCYSNEQKRLQESKALHMHTFGVSVKFEEGLPDHKQASRDNHVINYAYSLDYITNNTHPYILFLNFEYLFEYVDTQRRITLVANEKNLGAIERFMSVSAQDEYRGGLPFSLSEMTSQAQIVVYSKWVNKLDTSLEDIIHYVFEKSFREKYNFADNARFSVPTATTFLEKIRSLAPEFESILKQFKIFVEEGHIDFELLQISSSPSSIGDIPSLNQDKYIYLNEKNTMLKSCLNIFFSDQRNLSYVKPYKDKGYSTFFELLRAEEEVKCGNYEDYQKPELNYLIDNGFISITEDDFVVVTNPARLMILNDLHHKGVGAFYNYPIEYRQEVRQMVTEDMVYHETTLFSKPEQSYFNYCLNKKEFTNGLDLRNSYLHGTQANHSEVNVHESNYFIYLKLIFLALLKIEDDLNSNMASKSNMSN